VNCRGTMVNGPAFHGMQEVRSSSLRSSTFPQVRAIYADLDRLLFVQEVTLSRD
jgi:hypothetical protein